MSKIKKYDLSERTSKLGEQVIVFCKKCPKTLITKPLINQLIKAGTSVGANYCEADDADSAKDFRHKIAISKKEARETMFFIRMIVKAEPIIKNSAIALYQEVKEVHLILNSIYRKVKDK